MLGAISLMPQVLDFKRLEGVFRLEATARLAVGPDAAPAAALLREYLTVPIGFELPIVPETARQPGDILLRVHHQPQLDRIGLADESYRLEATPRNVVLEAENRFGLCRAIQTLRQLLPPEIYSSQAMTGGNWTLPCVSIADTPRFRWRGLHFDVARHFFTPDEVCRFIELVAQHKYNILHWHLTDDQGWRLEIDKYPKLTEIGAYRPCSQDLNSDRLPVFDHCPHGGFYTKSEIRRIIAFADQRGMVIMPEIDMPGHIQSAIAAYSWLGNRSDRNPGVKTAWGTGSIILNPTEKTFAFLEDVLKEIMELFPFRVIHIGGDEVRFDEWEANPLTRKLVEDNGLSGFRELEHWFMTRIANFVSVQGRIPARWDGGISVRDALSTAWLGKRGTLIAARLGEITVVANCDRFYFDHYQDEPAYEPPAFDRNVIQSCEMVYRYRIIPEELETPFTANIIGGQGAVWTEHIPDFRQVEYMLFPRACALAEKLWRDHKRCDYSEFLARLKSHRIRLSLQKVNAHPRP